MPPIPAACLLLGLLPVLTVSLPAQQPGCTDPQALNYAPQATHNDGSCLYPGTNFTPVLLSTLSDTLRETSGLAWAGGMLWTHNDSGSSPSLYALDPGSGAILRQVNLAGTSSIDWEDLAVNDLHLYIGDFGNNAGNRMDLAILRVSLDSLLLPDTDTLWPETIRFHYPEQTDFSPAPNQTPWDAEAFFFADDSLHVFTKDWVGQRTRLYTIPDLPGEHTALLSDSFDCQGLITGATIDQEGGEVVLCGYRNIGLGIWTCFAWLLFDYPQGQPLRGNRRRIELGTALALGQTEGIAMTPEHRGWLSGEALSAGPFSQAARLLEFDFTGFFSGDPTAADPVKPPVARLRLFPNPANGPVYWDADASLLGRSWRLVSPLGTVIREGRFQELLGVLDTGTLPDGVWYLVVEGLPGLTKSLRTER